MGISGSSYSNSYNSQHNYSHRSNFPATKYSPTRPRNVPRRDPAPTPAPTTTMPEEPGPGTSFAPRTAEQDDGWGEARGVRAQDDSNDMSADKGKGKVLSMEKKSHTTQQGIESWGARTNAADAKASQQEGSGGGEGGNRAAVESSEDEDEDLKRKKGKEGDEEKKGWVKSMVGGVVSFWKKKTFEHGSHRGSA